MSLILEVLEEDVERCLKLWALYPIRSFLREVLRYLGEAVMHCSPHFGSAAGVINRLGREFKLFVTSSETPDTGELRRLGLLADEAARDAVGLRGNVREELVELLEFYISRYEKLVNELLPFAELILEHQFLLRGSKNDRSGTGLSESLARANLNLFLSREPTEQLDKYLEDSALIRSRFCSPSEDELDALDELELILQAHVLLP